MIAGDGDVPESDPQNHRQEERSRVLQGVRDVFSEHLSIHEIAEDADLFEELELDSLQQLTLVVEIENRFKICFEEADEHALRTVGDVVDRVVRHLSATPPASD